MNEKGESEREREREIEKLTNDWSGMFTDALANGNLCLYMHVKLPSDIEWKNELKKIVHSP